MPSTTKNPKVSQQEKRPKWHYIYFLLAAFDLLTVSASLYLNHRLMLIYTASVTVNQEWAVRLGRYATLSQLAGAVNAPGNDVFDSHDVPGESARLHSALAQFTTALEVAREELQTIAPQQEATLLRQNLDSVHVSMTAMVAEANLIFSYFVKGEPEQAGARMATMDRRYSALNASLADLNEQVREIQKRHFMQQLDVAGSLRRFEYLIAGLIVLMVGGVTLYGHKIAQELTKHTTEREQYVEALHHANAALQVEINERKQLDAALQESQALFHSFMNHSPALAFLKNEAGQYRYVNHAFERMSKHETQDIMGKTDFDLWSAEFAQRIRNNDLEVLATGKVSEFVESTQNIEGARYWLSFKFPIQDGAGRRLLGGVSIDITERQEAERLKDELVATVSHELRTPLASLRGFAELMLKREYSPEKRQQFLTIIHNEAFRLTNLINDFLDLQRIESGQQTYHFVDTNLDVLISEAIATFSQQDGKHQWIKEISSSLPNIQVERDRIRQVLANLLSNAVKFSPTGGAITVRATEQPKEILITIADQGIGIPSEALPKLFKKFFRVDNGESRNIGGTGLGLALVKNIIEAHGGRIWVESLPGKGSSFFFTLPQQQSTVTEEHGPIINEGVAVL